MKKILVIGCKGMAGHIIFKYLTELNTYEVYAIARNVENEGRVFNLDVSNINNLNKIFELDFDVIINCIGILNKDAEDNPAKAIWYNSYFPHYLEHITRETKTKVISISTDCVFSGEKGDYTDRDFKDGKGFYAQSKALGEIINSKDLTIRTSIIGPELNKKGIGLFHWFMNQTGEINGYSDVFWSGITTVELAKAINQIIFQDLTGLVILAASPKIDKYNLLKLFNLHFRKGSIKVNSDSNYKVDKSMRSIRSDFNYDIPSYETMILEMRDWINNNKSIYNYKILL
jgi:dTDP-4-dehydrorhamnose reductase